MNYAIGSPGQPPRVFFSGSDEAMLYQVAAGEVFVPVEEPGDYLISEDGLRCVPRPKTLDELRMEVWDRVKAQREAAIDAGAPTPHGAVDSDTDGRSNVAGAALSANIALSSGQPYSITWTMLDNSTKTLNAVEMIEVGLAVLAHVDACHNKARAFRTEIEAAADEAALLAIDVTAGWP